MRRGCGGTTLGLLGEGAGGHQCFCKLPRARGVSRPLLFFSLGVGPGRLSPARRGPSSHPTSASKSLTFPPLPLPLPLSKCNDTSSQMPASWLRSK